MKKYRIRADKGYREIWVTQAGLFREKLLQKFTNDGYQKAIDYSKVIATKHRPSRVTIINNKGEITRQWDYRKLAAPRVYENAPRKRQ